MTVALANFILTGFGNDHMADLVFIIVTIFFFVLSWLYVRGCDHL